MKFAILALIKPQHVDKGDPTPLDSWRSMVDSIETTAFATTVKPQRLGDGVWQFDLTSGLRNFILSAAAANGTKLEYRVLFLDEEPVWAVAPALSPR